jgi:hypothetical protein
MSGEHWVINSDYKLDNVKRHIEQAYEKDKFLTITCVTGKKRTNKQNNALHLWCEQLATVLNDRQLDLKVMLDHHPTIDWNRDAVKNFLWKPVQKAQAGVDSTTKAKTSDYPAVYDILNKYLAEKYGVHVPWPQHDE